MEADGQQRVGLSLLAIRRNGLMLDELTDDTVIELHDMLYVFGKPAQVEHLVHEMQPAEA